MKKLIAPVAALVLAVPAGAAIGTTRVSLTSAGAEAAGESRQPALSHDGRYVVFVSSASNLVGGDTNGVADVFVRDRAAGMTTRVSVTSTGVQANGASDRPSVSGEGRYVVFESAASNLVTGDTNAVTDVYLHDRSTRKTTRVSIKGTTQANGASAAPVISANAAFVAFESTASNLVAGDTNHASDIIVWNRSTKVLTRASVSSAGAQATSGSHAPAISRDGRYVAFASWSANLAPGAGAGGALQVYRRDTVAKTTILASALSSGAPEPNGAWQPALSGDGQRIAYATTLHVYIRDVAAATNVRVSVSSAGVAGDGHSFEPALSDDGRFVAFYSWSTNLAPADVNVKTSCRGTFTPTRGSSCPDLFVRDLFAGTTRMDSVTPLGTSGNDATGSTGFAAPGETSIGAPAITPNGLTTAFASVASDLVAADTNGLYDVFVRES